jgi:glycine betaine/proline transport system substrate-binding protein
MLYSLALKPNNKYKFFSKKRQNKEKKMRTKFIQLWLSFVLAAAAAVIVSACGAGGGGGAASEPKPTLKLVQNPWSASELNVNVAKIILEEKMGYPVEIVTLDESAQWAALASGDAHASLEVWPSGHGDNIAKYIDEQKAVENGGPLGPVGKIGWYIPSYMVEQDASLTSFEAFKDPAKAALFATAETGEMGQFLAGSPGWTQYDADIIKNLGLNLEVVSAGSEEAVLSAVAAAYDRKEPVLFYFWTPHSIHAKYDLTEVKLPEYSDACYEKVASGGVDCDYPADVLFKIFWSDLKTFAPEAYTMLKNMNYTTEDQINLIAAVELDGKKVDEAARAWVDGNEAKWQAWLPQQ